MYHDDVDDILEIIRSVSNNYLSVMLVGHEPKWSSLTSMMIGAGDITFSTAAMSKIEYQVDDWKDIEYRTGQLKWLLQPSFFRKGSFEF